MKRVGPWSQSHVVSSDDSSDSDSENGNGIGNAKSNNMKATGRSTEDDTSESAVMRRAKMYQEYMKQIPIPSCRGSVIPFTTWQGLAKSLKLLYGQPLHYLTNAIMKQWDQSRSCAGDGDHRPLDAIVHPSKAEAVIWVMEEVHRLTTSHQYLAKLWACDPMHHALIDPIIQQL